MAARIFRIERDGVSRHALERDGTTHLIEGDLFEQWASGGDFRLGAEVIPARLLAPLQPSKIVAVGLNYRDHAAERGKELPAEPLIFIKPSTAVVGPGESICLPPGSGRVDYEAEVALVIGRRAHRVPRERAWEYVLGVTALNDVTERDLQRRDVQYTRAKGFDTFAPMGPCILTDERGPFQVEAWVNGDRRQFSTTSQLIFPFEELVEFVTGVMTLLPGDVISTGTPAGVGPMKAGDRVTIKVSGVGELTNPVIG